MIVYNENIDFFLDIVRQYLEYVYNQFALSM